MRFALSLLMALLLATCGGCASTGSYVYLLPVATSGWTIDKDDPRRATAACGADVVSIFSGPVAHTTGTIGPPLLPVIPVGKSQEWQFELELSVVAAKDDPIVNQFPKSVDIATTAGDSHLEITSVGSSGKSSLYSDGTMHAYRIYSFGYLNWNTVDEVDMKPLSFGSCTLPGISFKRDTEHYFKAMEG